MQVHDLPDDVLLLVLEASLDCRPEATAALKANLPLLAVCRRWRSLALAPVYSGLTICYGTKPSNTSDPGNGQANSADDELDNAEITMSPDLVVAAGYVQMVRQVKIIVHHKNSPLPGLDAVVRLMHAAAEEWRGVRQLELSTLLTDRALDYRVNVAAHSDRAKQISAALAATMPGVCRVHLDGHYVNSVVKKLGGQLAVLYSDQLESLTSKYSITVPQDHTFRQLKSASIYCGSSTSHQHPRVDPAKLVSLELRWWPVDHSWAPFSADNDSEVIEFPNLKNLRVMYEPASLVGGAGARHRDGRPWKLRFPKLNKLEVSHMQDRCSLLEYAVLPQRMGEIFIGAAASVLVRAAETGLPTFERLGISVDSHANDGPAALAAVSCIFENSQESRVAVLSVIDRLLPVPPESITCTSLTELEMHANTSVDAMLELIHKLPNLTRLDVFSVTLSDIQGDISIPGPDEDHLVGPFSSKIKTMQIAASLGEPEPELLAPVAKYLLLRIPTMARFCSIRLKMRQFAEFADAYSKRYPHLASVNYLLNDYDDN